MIPVLGVPVLNNPGLLYRMLKSIDHPVQDLIVIDNGRVVDPLTVRTLTEEWARHTHVLRMPTNLGVPASWNLIIKSLPFAPWWLIVNSDVVWPQDSLAWMAREARADALVLSGGSPPWCAFAIGEAVAQASLFDEGVVPAYFEDNLMERACDHHGLDVVRTGVPVLHDNSSTIKDPTYAVANSRTFAANLAYFTDKVTHGDYSEGRWSLARRRELSWD